MGDTTVMVVTDTVTADTDMVRVGMDTDMATKTADTVTKTMADMMTTVMVVMVTMVSNTVQDMVKLDMDMDTDMADTEMVILMDTLQAITDHPRATPTLRTGKEVTKAMLKLKANLARNDLL